MAEQMTDNRGRTKAPDFERLNEDVLGGCSPSKDKLIETADWFMEHSPHGEITEAPIPHAPEGYEFRNLVCPCGAKHATNVQITQCRKTK